MPTIRLTKSAVDALKAARKDAVYWDGGLPGFGVKVTPRGRKVFVALYRLGGAGSRLRKYTIGPYGRVTLQMARAEAQKIFAARLEGRDPAAEKREARRRMTADRVEDLVEIFILQHVSKTRKAAEVSRMLRREVVSRWGNRSVREINKRDVIELASEIAQRGTPIAANKLLKVVKTFLNWCAGRAVIDSSPAEGVPLPGKEVARDRVLTDGELASVIVAARTMGGAYGGIVEMLALTGQRREEVAGMVWDEIDLGNRTWMLPGLRTKNARPHIVHLSEPCIELIARVPRLGDYVFSLSGVSPFQNFARAKRALDELSGVTDWRLHDLRRTCVSGMARLGVPPHVADKILNHQSGTISGVAAVYQRHDFLAERKLALERWGQHIETLVGEMRPAP
ncbi:MAG: integrase arm-type DNA-binding domain-containing protein [Rhodoplanes sp.]